MFEVESMREKQRMLVELTNIHNRGISIFLDGSLSSPFRVMDAISLFNGGEVFMPDYVTDERGVLTEIRYDKVSVEC